MLMLLALAAVVAFVLVKVSGRQPVAKISATTPVRQTLVSSISSNGKVEPITPYSIRAQLDTFVEKVGAAEGQNVKKGQTLLQLNVKDAGAQWAAAKSRLLRAQDDLRAAKAGGRAGDAAKVTGDLANAKAQLDLEQRNHDALEHLLKEGAATKDEVAANELALTKAKEEVNRLTGVKQEYDRGVNLDASHATLTVEQAQSEVAALEDKVRQGRIIAPVDGTLYSLPVKAGDFVKVDLPLSCRGAGKDRRHPNSSLIDLIPQSVRDRMHCLLGGCVRTAAFDIICAGYR